MVRFFVTAYMLAATALGPALCCCTLGEWTSARSRCCSPLVNEKPAHAHRPHSHHHCHSHAAGPHVPEAPKKPAPAKPDQCPCERHCAGQVAVAEKSTFESEWLVSGAPVFADAVFAFDLPSFAQADGLAIEQHALDSPLLNSRAVLRALHVLRC